MAKYYQLQALGVAILILKAFFTAFLYVCKFYHKGKGKSDFPVVMYGCESWTVKKAER